MILLASQAQFRVLKSTIAPQSYPRQDIRLGIPNRQESLIVRDYPSPTHHSPYSSETQNVNTAALQGFILSPCPSKSTSAPASDIQGSQQLEFRACTASGISRLQPIPQSPGNWNFAHVQPAPFRARIRHSSIPGSGLPRPIQASPGEDPKHGKTKAKAENSMK